MQWPSRASETSSGFVNRDVVIGETITCWANQVIKKLMAPVKGPQGRCRKAMDTEILHPGARATFINREVVLSFGIDRETAMQSRHIPCRIDGPQWFYCDGVVLVISNELKQNRLNQEAVGVQ